MVQTPRESSGKSWLKEINMIVRRDTNEALKTKNAASLVHTMRREDGVLFDRDT
jgi:hypothetical protein